MYGMPKIYEATSDADLLAIKRLLSPCCIISILEVHKGIHAAREGDHILHRPMLLKHSLQHSSRQSRVQVTQPQVFTGTCNDQCMVR